MSLWRLGHSTLLLKLQGRFWLTDPVPSERASPFSFMGPKRFHAPPISIDALPPITGVLLSHDHYDHLDFDAIQRLAPRSRTSSRRFGRGRPPSSPGRAGQGAAVRLVAGHDHRAG